MLLYVRMEWEWDRIGMKWYTHIKSVLRIVLVHTHSDTTASAYTLIRGLWQESEVQFKLVKKGDDNNNKRQWRWKGTGVGDWMNWTAQQSNSNSNDDEKRVITFYYLHLLFCCCWRRYDNMVKIFITNVWLENDDDKEWAGREQRYAISKGTQQSDERDNRIVCSKWWAQPAPATSRT